MQAKQELVAIQWVSEAPERMVAFYEEHFGVKFKKYNYPHVLFAAIYDRITFVVHDKSSMKEGEEGVAPVALTFLSEDKLDLASSGGKRMIWPARPAGRNLPQSRAVTL